MTGALTLNLALALQGPARLLVHAAPDGRQVGVALHADGAGQLAVALHLLEAVAVNGVPAGQHRRRAHAVEQVLEAHRTVLAHAVLHAHVVALHGAGADVLVSSQHSEGEWHMVFSMHT